MRTGKVARIADRVRKELGELTPQERDLAVKALRAALYEGFALDAATSDPNQMEACVRCGSIRIIRKGRGRDGSQRWKCMNCNRTFGVRTNRVMGMSKLKAGVWMRFLECFVDCLSLRKCAQRCGVCLKTAFLMRQRVIECIRRYTPVLRSEAGMSVQLDETYFRESFKGNHTKSAVFVMPRKAHKRTKALRKRGLSKEQICVATGVDDAGRSFLTVCGRGIISKDRAMSALKVHIGRGTDVLTDGAPAYVKPLAELGANLTQASADGHAINRVNTLHAPFGGFHVRLPRRVHEVPASLLGLVPMARRFYRWVRRDRRRPIACPPARQRPVPHPPSRLPAYDAAVHGVLAKSRMTSCIRCTVRTSKHRTRRRVWRAYPPRP